MKQMTKIIIGIMMVCLFAGTTMAVDINALDQVGVLMTKSKVVSILGMPDDVAKAALFLASDMSAYITGETINLNGGMHMS